MLPARGRWHCYPQSSAVVPIHHHTTLVVDQDATWERALLHESVAAVGHSRQTYALVDWIGESAILWSLEGLQPSSYRARR